MDQNGKSTQHTFLCSMVYRWSGELASPSLHALHEAKHNKEHWQHHKAHHHERLRVHLASRLVWQLMHGICSRAHATRGQSVGTHGCSARTSVRRNVRGVLCRDSSVFLAERNWTSRQRSGPGPATQPRRRLPPLGDGVTTAAAPRRVPQRVQEHAIALICASRASHGPGFRGPPRTFRALAIGAVSIPLKLHDPHMHAEGDTHVSTARTTRRRGPAESLPWPGARVTSTNEAIARPRAPSERSPAARACPRRPAGRCSTCSRGLASSCLQYSRLALQLCCKRPLSVAVRPRRLGPLGPAAEPSGPGYAAPRSPRIPVRGCSLPLPPGPGNDLQSLVPAPLASLVIIH